MTDICSGAPAGPGSAPHLLGAALAAVRSQPSELSGAQEFRRSGELGAQEFRRAGEASWAESQQPRSFSVLGSPARSEAISDYNSYNIYHPDPQQQQQSDYNYHSTSGALSPSIFDQFQPFSSEDSVEGKRQSHSELCPGGKVF